MSSTNRDDHQLVVAEDGSIPAEQVARVGLRPGWLLRVVVEGRQEPAAGRKTAKGILAGKVDGDAVVRALEDAKAERLALLGRDE